jgi:hypothetical protein
MDLINLLKLAGLAVQSPAANAEVEEDVPGKANTKPDPQIFPDGPSNLGSVSDTSLRRYLKAKGQPVSVDETTYPDYSVDDVLESYEAYTAEKAKNPYAIGMASAMKTTGDKPPLKKSTINKAHKIAKGIDESSLDEAGGIYNPRVGLSKPSPKPRSLPPPPNRKKTIDRDRQGPGNVGIDESSLDEAGGIYNPRAGLRMPAPRPRALPPPLKRKKTTAESSLNEANWRLDGGKTHMVGGNLSYDDKLEYLLSDEDADVINNFLAQADDDEKSKVWRMFWDHQEMGDQAEGPELAIQYAKDAMGMNESDEAMSGTYAEVEYDYSEDFGMITLYKNGQKIEHWNGYFGADTVGNPLADKFVELAMKHNLNPEGMSITDDTGATGTFNDNTFNWDQFAKDETSMNESINESYISELTRVLKNSGQLLNEAGGIGGGISGGKFGMPKSPAPAVNAVRPDVVARNEPNLQQLMSKLPGMDQSKANRQELGFAVQGDRAGPQTGQPKPKADAPFTLGRFANQATVAAPKPAAPTIAARPEGPAAGMPRATPGGARPEGPAAAMPRATPGGARPEGPAAAMPKAPPQPASFKDAFRAARKAAGGAGGTFMWNGKPYQTNIKGEPAMKWNSPELKKVGNWSASESADSDGIAVNEAVAKIACTKCDEVSTAAAWNKNHDTCPKCKTSKQGVAEAAKPDFLDMDKDGNKKEPMKKALKDKEKVSESISYLKRLAGL